MTWAYVCVGIGSVVVGGASAYLNYKAGKKEPPKLKDVIPASYYTYDADGNLTGSQIWNKELNGYVTRDYLSPEQKVMKEKVDALKSQLLENLSQTPADRLQAYQNYAQTYSDTLHKDADKQFSKLKSSEEESLASKGMIGTKAYADIMSDLSQQKTDMDTDIANKSALEAENLANTDKAMWLSELNSLENNENADAALALQSTGLGNTIANSASSISEANNQLQNSGRLASWQNRVNSLNSMANSINNTATGLAYLYGYKSKGKDKGSTQIQIGTPMKDDYFSTLA